MIQEDFKKQYPNLWKLLNILSFANDMAMRDTFGDLSGVRCYELNIQAGRLDEEEYELLADGEETEMKALVRRKSLWALDEFLTSAFDGELMPEFYTL